MDPSCGKCVSSDCRGNPSWTDPKCPEHGAAAQATAKAKLDAQVATLSTRTLRKLVAASTKKSREQAFQRHPLFDHTNLPDKAAELIRRRTSSILYQAKQGGRRAMLFRVSLGTSSAKPESELSGARKLVYEHFKARVRIVFRHIWNDHYDGEYDVWAVW